MYRQLDLIGQYMIYACMGTLVGFLKKVEFRIAAMNFCKVASTYMAAGPCAKMSRNTKKCYHHPHLNHHNHNNHNHSGKSGNLQPEMMMSGTAEILNYDNIINNGTVSRSCLIQHVA